MVRKKWSQSRFNVSIEGGHVEGSAVGGEGIGGALPGEAEVGLIDSPARGGGRPHIVS